MTIKLPSFPRELVGSDRLLSLSLSLQDSFFLQDGEKRSFFSSFLIAVVQQQLDRWIVWKNEDGKCAKRFPHSSLSLSLSSSRRVSVSILSGKKRKTSVDYYPRHIGSRAAAGETTWSVVTIDSIEIRDPGAGAASMEMFSLFFFLFFFI